MGALTTMLGPRRTRVAASLLLALLFCLAWPATVTRAQENSVSPPPPLQWPRLETGSTPNRTINIKSFRSFVEEAANETICKQLMKDAKVEIPKDFTFNQCPAKFKAQMVAHQGSISWVPGARPSECGTKCVGRPFMDRSTALDRPNTIFAKLFGSLAFNVDIKGAFNRKVSYNYEAEFRCLTKGGEREGEFTVRVLLGRPNVGEPGFLESITNFLVPFRLSDAIDAGLHRRLGDNGTNTQTLGVCDSVGVDKSGPPSDDFIPYNRPFHPKNPPPAGPANKVQGKSVTVHFQRVTRKQVPDFDFHPPEKAGGFRIFLNGAQGFFPDAPFVNLPATGGSAAIDLCRTIDMEDSKRLQLIFVNTHGGAVWSQFGPNAKFGAGRHKMTTGRTVVVTSPPGIPDPITGKPPISKPHSILVREFELLYTIEFNGPANEIIEQPPVTGGDTSTTGRNPGGGVVNPGGPVPPPRPCRKI